MAAARVKGDRRMAKLTTVQRGRLKTTEFALKEDRAYPIENISHARNALARVAQHGTATEKAAVRAAVHRKYPGIGKKGK